MSKRIPIGTEVIFIHDQDGVPPGSRGIIKGHPYYSEYSVYVTYCKDPSWHGHACSGEEGLFDSDSGMWRGWNVSSCNVEEFYKEIPYDPRQMMDQEDDI